MSEYERKAEEFLQRHGLKVRATFKGDKCPPWCGNQCCHGDRYRVTISRKGGGRISFDFWNSLHDMQEGNHPHPYDVLSCISLDAYCPDTFEDFCEEYGYDQDSRKAFSTWKQCDTFAERLRAFFTENELKELAEIQ